MILTKLMLWSVIEKRELSNGRKTAVFHFQAFAPSSAATRIPDVVAENSSRETARMFPPHNLDKFLQELDAVDRGQTEPHFQLILMKYRPQSLASRFTHFRVLLARPADTQLNFRKTKHSSLVTKTPLLKDSHSTASSLCK